MQVTHIQKEWAAVRINSYRTATVEIFENGGNIVLLKPKELTTTQFKKIAPLVKRSYLEKYGE